jgi:hypothetical protein
MSAQIERDFTFQAGVHFQDTFSMNIYAFTLNMEVTTENIREQQIAMERMKYFIHECLENSIFVQDTDRAIIEKYSACGIRVCEIPEEPYDQIIALLLLLKLESIAEYRLAMTDIVLTSKLSDDVRFKEDILTAKTEMPIVGWWAESNTATTNVAKVKNKKDKIVKMVNTSEWNDVGLSWEEDTANTSNVTEIIFTTNTATRNP